MENTEKSNSEPQGENNNPWGKKYQESVPQFRGGLGGDLWYKQEKEPTPHIPTPEPEPTSLPPEEAPAPWGTPMPPDETFEPTKTPRPPEEPTEQPPVETPTPLPSEKTPETPKTSEEPTPEPEKEEKRETPKYWEGSAEQKKMAERAALRKESEEIIDLYYEINQISDCTETATTFAEDFGLDFLAKRYGIGPVMDKVVQFSRDTVSHSAISSGRGIYEMATDCISGIYQSIEPDLNKRKVLFDEMTSVSDNDEDTPRRMRIQSNLYMSNNGEIKIMRSGESGELTGHQAWDGMRSMGLFAEHMTGETGYAVFADVSESINGGFKKLPEKARNAAEMLTDGIEHPGFDDLATVISERLSKKVDIYEGKVKDVQEKTSKDVAELEQKSKFELNEYNAPREETKKKIEALRENATDVETRRTLDEAIAGIDELMANEAQQMNAKLESDINHYYYSIINGGKDGLDSHAQAVDELKKSIRYLGKRDK